MKIICCGSCEEFSVSPGETAVVVSQFGRKVEVYNKSGRYTTDGLGTKVHKLYTNLYLTISDQQLNDKTGTPVFVTTKLSYTIRDVVKAVLGFENFSKYLKNQS